MSNEIRRELRSGSRVGRHKQSNQNGNYGWHSASKTEQFKARFAGLSEHLDSEASLSDDDASVTPYLIRGGSVHRGWHCGQKISVIVSPNATHLDRRAYKSALSAALHESPWLSSSTLGHSNDTDPRRPAERARNYARRSRVGMERCCF